MMHPSSNLVVIFPLEAPHTENLQGLTHNISMLPSVYVCHWHL